MSDCKTVDSFVTPYVDRELDEANRAALDAHLRVCPQCHSRVAAEREMRELLHAQRQLLKEDPAPLSLRTRCDRLSSGPLPSGARVSPPVTTEAPFNVTRDIRGSAAWRARLTPYALAAILVLIVGGAFVYQVTDRSVRVMAAELTADHVKCFGLHRMFGTQAEPTAVEGTIGSSFGWAFHLPDRPERAGLELVGAQPCLYGEGRVAHIMYRHNGNPVSVFMLPRSWRQEALVEVLGHEAAVWSVGDRTFVLIAREPRPEVERMASFVHAGLR